MERFVIDRIAFQPNVEALAAQLHVDRTSPYFEELASCVHEAQAVARPKAMYRVG